MKYGCDKEVVKCFRCGERGHFKCKCTKPTQYGNQNPFRNQTNQSNQNSNDTECAMSVQLGSGDSSGTTCYARVTHHIKHIQNGESSEDEGSYGYSEASDEENSSSIEDGIEEVSSETIDAYVEKLLSDADNMQSRRSILGEKAAVGSDDGYYSHHFAFMANVGGQSSQVCSDKPTSATCDKCVELGAKWSELEGKYDVTFIHNLKLIVDLSKSTEANTCLKKNEKEFRNVIETLRKDLYEVKKMFQENKWRLTIT
ncbi:putative transcription factor interactor and regulator CCHC(Zn) family [Helianthus anomalus]